MEHGIYETMILDAEHQLTKDSNLCIQESNEMSPLSLITGGSKFPACNAMSQNPEGVPRTSWVEEMEL